MDVKVLNETEFDNILNNEKYVLAEFSTSWCGHCLQLAPVIKEIADDYKDKIKVITINLSENDIGGTYNVVTVPTLIFFENNIIKSRIIAPENKSQISDWIEKQLNNLN